VHTSTNPSFPTDSALRRRGARAARELARKVGRPVAMALGCAMLLAPRAAPGEAMLQLFNVNWDELIQKMPEIAEAGYTSLWLPPPSKGGSVYSVGYDHFDPFDLGDKNQRGTVRTRYGTKAELLQVVELAHRFGLRVYFDNIMNHRAFDVPGFNSSTPTNLYPGLVPKDFHLQTVGSYFANWPSVEDYGDPWKVQYESLGGLVDLATEPGSVNGNFGPTLGSTTAKPVFIRHPGSNSYYMDQNLPAIEGSPWHPFNGTNGDPVAEDVNAYLIRSALYILNETKCDGFRLDAVKHVPSGFFGDTTPTFNGYCGAIQAMFDYVHGYGTNVLGNGYFEADDSRNSCFNPDAPRNDALLFGEHLGQPPSYGEYIARGMRLLNSPLRDTMNWALGGGSLAGLDQASFGDIIPPQSVMFAQSHDQSGCCATHRDLQNAYYFMHEGMAVIYSDGYNQSGPPNYFPTPPYANYLGEFGDNTMPDTVYVHHQLARGLTSPRWSEQNLVAFERYDTREGGSQADQTVVLFVLNDKYSFPGDITFDDGVAQASDGYYGSISVSNTKHVGLAVGFPPGSVLAQLASSSPTGGRAYQKLLVHNATTSLAAAQASANDPNPVNRLVYVGGQTIPPGGGAVELNVPSGSWVLYGYQWPEASRANLKTSAILLQQGGADVPRITVYRHDGVNGDPNFNPIYPFKMRGSVDATGALITGVNVSNRTYAIDVPIVTNGPLDILVRSDASTVNTLVKLDGGVDLNSQMGVTNNYNGDYRDNRPGAATDVFLGYEQSAFQFRYGPEKFAAAATNRNTVVSLGAETYYYTVGGTNWIVNGPTNAPLITNGTAAWVIHDPAAAPTVAGGPPTQRVPLNPTNGGPVDVWVRAGYQFQINRCCIYYTTDGSNPEGAFGVGKGTTKVVTAAFAGDDTVNGAIDWWKGTIPAVDNTTGAQIRYKVALFKDDVTAIIDYDDAKLYGLNQAAITNFNPATATVWLHNDRNPNHTRVGLSEGFHIIRARCFLPRTNKSSVFNTFAQTFYYDSALPAGVIATPAGDGTNVTTTTYQFVVRADSTVTAVEFNIADSDPNNDDTVTGQNNGNGQTNGVDKYVGATAATPNATLSALYPDYPLEFRFTYGAVPTNGTATVKVRLKEASSTVLPGRYTELTRTVNTLAPGQVMQITDPAADGMVLTLETNDVYPIHVCFSQSLGNNIDFFSLYINGVYQPRRAPNDAPLYFISPGCGSGLRLLSYDWTGADAGTNVIQVVYTNTVIQSDTRIVTVERPVNYTLDSDGDGMPDWMEQIAGTDPQDPNSLLRITELANGHRLVVWDSVSNVNYQVLATTNLSEPMQPLSPILPASGPTSFYFDASPDAPIKFYRIQVVP
jgi:hypothetical protein